MEDIEEDEEERRALGTGPGHPGSRHVHHGNCCSHDHSDEREVYQMPTEVKLAACDGFQKEALAFFQETQWFRAKVRFQKVLVYLDYTFPSTEEEQAWADELKKSALVKAAVCALKLAAYRETISLASQVIREWPHVAKAYYCRGKARRLLGEFAEAREDLILCSKHAPNNVDVNIELKMLESDERIYRNQSALLAKDMFAGDRTESVSVPVKVHESKSLRYQ